MSEADRHFKVLPPEAGESFWQPEPANGYVTIKACPAMLPGIGFSQGIQVIPPRSYVREHAHEDQEEVIFCLEGHGNAEIDGKAYPMTPGTVISLGRGVRHRFVNDSQAELKFVWTISGPGLEHFFKTIGRPKLPGESAAAPFERPEGRGPDEKHGLLAQRGAG